MSDQEPVEITLPREDVDTLFSLLHKFAQIVGAIPGSHGYHNKITNAQIMLIRRKEDAIAAQLRAQGEGE